MGKQDKHFWTVRNVWQEIVFFWSSESSTFLDGWDSIQVVQNRLEMSFQLFECTKHFGNLTLIIYVTYRLLFTRLYFYGYQIFRIGWWNIYDKNSSLQRLMLMYNYQEYVADQSLKIVNLNNLIEKLIDILNWNLQDCN